MSVEEIGTVTLSIALALTAIVALAAGWGLARVLQGKFPGNQPRDTPETATYEMYVELTNSKQRALERKIGELRADYQMLTKAVAEGIEHVDRNEKRVRGIVTGAQRKFEASGYADPGVDAEADTLPLDDATGFANEELPDVPETLGRNPWEAVPGMIK